MKLVKEIRDGVVDSSISLSSVLRKAKILAVSLNNAEFRQWVDYELNGYSDEVDPPPYRKLTCPVLGNFSGPFDQIVNDYLLPLGHLPDEFKKMADPVLCGNPIKEIESLADSGKEGLRRPWPTEMVIFLRDKITMSRGCLLVEIYQPITKAQLEGILDAVRNRLLDFVLALQEINPKILKSEEALGKITSEEVSQVFNVTIHGDHNVLASGSGINQQVTQNIAPFDKNALMNSLAELGLETEDLKALDRAIDADGRPKRKKLGQKVTDWLGKMTAKAVAGTSKALGTSAPTLITKAISKYYGWD